MRAEWGAVWCEGALPGAIGALTRRLLRELPGAPELPDEAELPAHGLGAVRGEPSVALAAVGLRGMRARKAGGATTPGSTAPAQPSPP